MSKYIEILKEREIKLANNKLAQKEMRDNLNHMWFPNSKDLVPICRIASDNVELHIDKTIGSIGMNNLANKTIAILNYFDSIHNKLKNFSITFDKEYIDLKVKEAELQYDVIYAKRLVKGEEEARREVIKQQEKEERALLKEKEKEERELARMQYEYAKAKSRELDEKIRQAEYRIGTIEHSLRNKRAGYIYVVSNDTFGRRAYKVGVTRRAVEERMKELASASVAFKMNINGCVYSEDIFGAESAVHNYLDKYRINKVNSHKEWFDCSLDTIKEAFKKACDIDIELKDVHNDEFVFSRKNS